MKTTARSAQLVPALAVTAMSLAALAAAAAGWFAERQPVEAPAMQAALQQQRPRADEPARVVRAPRDGQQRQERTL
jgi:hypothetical protein